ncbi:MAG: TonB-dependent receptor [Nitrospirae bacterium]|nr:TonB-dependent receptor [Nitrospirota bacterium]
MKWKSGNNFNANRSLLLFSSWILSLIILPSFAFAQSEEELKILRMYFKEDELVITPTRTPKPISKVAENISVVTAKEIEEMNAHTVLEVLERVTGVFVEFFGHDFGSDASLKIQGSEDRHVLVLMDGIPWNFMTGGSAVTNSIPVKIIKRIEIIKGPASSSWGSSLGGVINIVTKDMEENTGPSGSLSASIGERDTHDYSAEVTGKSGIGYYLYAGRQDSDGLRDHRFFENNSFYSKFDIPIISEVNLLLTIGYSEPRINTGDLPSFDISSVNTSRAFFTTASLSAELSEELSLEASFYTFKNKLVQENDVLGITTPAEAGDLFQNSIFDEKTDGGNARLTWMHDVHNAVIGTDISHGSLDQTIIAGQSLQNFGAPETSESHPGISKWAVFANDTISFGNFAVTPGIRYDKNNISGDFTSPSLGTTYKIAKHTLLRAAVAKGFTTPPLSFTSGGALFLDPNPDLKPEKIWSYHAGVESWIAEFLRAKVAVFHHDVKDALVKELFAAPNGNDLFFNKGEIKRDGAELDVETASFYNVSLTAGVAYVRKKDIEEETSTDNYAYNLAAKYDDRKSFSAQLAGHYAWWDRPSDDMSKYDAFIWDLNLTKKVYSLENINADIFITAHNLFNSSQYTLGDRKNPHRWVEAGGRLKF